MKTILIHGLGQDAKSWQKTISFMTHNDDILCLNLSSLLHNKEANYTNLYTAFVKYCQSIEGQIDLCGLSLGGILALNYTLDYPNKVRSLVLISTPHHISQMMLSIQTIIFRILPKIFFKNMGFHKQDILTLSQSMKHLSFFHQVQNITCPTLLIYGKKDNTNLKSAYYFSQNIKNAQLKILENTGHIINEEQPQQLAKILNQFSRINNSKGFGYCGLACDYCQDRPDCVGCKKGGCPDKETCKNYQCCTIYHYQYCYECPKFPCSDSILHKLRVRTFCQYIQKYGEEDLTKKLKDNHKKGIMYHYPHQHIGDYDQFQTEDEIMNFIKHGQK